MILLESQHATCARHGKSRTTNREHLEPGPMLDDPDEDDDTDDAKGED